MSGYAFSSGKERPGEMFKESAQSGVFSTTMSTLASITFENTLADHATIQQVDNIYFLYIRKLYGIGTLSNATDYCKHCNQPHYF